MSVRIQVGDFMVQEEYDAIVAEAGDAGAIVIFTGLVREFHQADQETAVTTLTLEHYPGMTEKALSEIAIVGSPRV